MARSAEQNKAYYDARDQRARDRGFSSYGQERRYKTEHKEEIAAVLTSQSWREMHTATSTVYDPKQAQAFYERVLVHEDEDVVTGRMRHDAVAYFREYEDMSEDEAVAEMRILFGDS